LATNNTGSIPNYTKKAIVLFNEIMSKKKDIMNYVNRANKGELSLLHYLSLNDTPSLPSKLSIEMQCSAARVSALLSSLEKKELIKRDIDKDNHRNILETITDAGRERAIEGVSEIEQTLAYVFVEMGEADTTDYLKLFEKFLRILHDYLDEDRQRS